MRSIRLTANNKTGNLRHWEKLKYDDDKYYKNTFVEARKKKRDSVGNAGLNICWLTNSEGIKYS